MDDGGRRAPGRRRQGGIAGCHRRVRLHHAGGQARQDELQGGLGRHRRDEQPGWRATGRALDGGKGGGGTRLTQRGRQLVDNFRIIEREHARYLRQLGSQAEGIADDLLLIRRMAMKTTARNQFLGKVAQLKTGAVNDEVILELPGGQHIVAIVTQGSSASLGLAVGVEAFALIKASSVILVADSEGARFSARNQLLGSVTRVQTGAVNTEVVLDLPGGGTIAAIVTNQSSSDLGITEGGKLTAIFKASSVILGVPA